MCQLNGIVRIKTHIIVVLLDLLVRQSTTWRHIDKKLLVWVLSRAQLRVRVSRVRIRGVDLRRRNRGSHTGL